MTDRGWRPVAAIALAQLVSWGSIYYSFSLFVVPIETELGWSRTAINGALSLGLLVSGLWAYPIGAWIDRQGGRLVMSLGSALAALLLAAWSRLDSLAEFYLVWLGLGFVVGATFYEPAFAVITRRFPESYRTRITALTLIGGFASTVFIPLTQALIDHWGWRGALLALALCNLVIALPIHALLRDRKPERCTAMEIGCGDDGALRRALGHPAFWGLALCFTAYYATFSALTFHLIPLLTERRLPGATVIAAAALIGPAQVAGRIALLAANAASPGFAGRIATMAFPLSVLLLIAFPRSLPALFAFAGLYGGANGIITIVRGTAVPELIGRAGYGAINGALALPANIARGTAPFAAAALWQATGSYDAALWFAAIGGVIAALGFWSATLYAAPD